MALRAAGRRACLPSGRSCAVKARPDTRGPLRVVPLNVWRCNLWPGHSGRLAPCAGGRAPAVALRHRLPWLTAPAPVRAPTAIGPDGSAPAARATPEPPPTTPGRPPHPRTGRCGGSVYSSPPPPTASPGDMHGPSCVLRPAPRSRREGAVDRRAVRAVRPPAQQSRAAPASRLRELVGRLRWRAARATGRPGGAERPVHQAAAGRTAVLGTSPRAPVPRVRPAAPRAQQWRLFRKTLGDLRSDQHAGRTAGRVHAPPRATRSRPTTPSRRHTLVSSSRTTSQRCLPLGRAPTAVRISLRAVLSRA